MTCVCSAVSVDPALVKRFWAKVKKAKNSECWLWTATKKQGGYGRINADSSGLGFVLAHRLSWMIHTKTNPDKNLVLHSCDNPQCVNPHHLSIGTHQDNMADMVAKKRAAKVQVFGVRNSKTVISDLEVMRIMNLSLTTKEIAEMYGVRKGAILNIKNVRGIRLINAFAYSDNSSTHDVYFQGAAR